MKFLFFICASIAVCSLNAQNLPDQWAIQPEAHQLLIGKAGETGLYNRDVIREFYLEFDASNYWSLLAANYGTENFVTATLTVDGVSYPQVGVQFRGQTSYQQIQNSEKKSFAIKTDAFIAGQDIDGYNNFNLNNCFGDASFMREFLYYSLIRKHVPASKCSFVKLYLNGESWGLYPSVEQLNKDFLEEWFESNDGTNWRADAPSSGGGGGGPQWGDGTAALNFLGANASSYQSYYTLKSNTVTDPWADLIETCDVLNNTPIADLPAELPDVLDIDRTLWVLAIENAFADDDSYIYKGKMDYFCYWEMETGRMVIQEYDANSLLSNNNLTWSPFYHADNGNYPLLNRLLQVPMWRQRYLAHMRTVLDELLNPAVINPILQDYSAFVNAEVQADTKKIYTYAQFTSGVTSLQNNALTRRNNLLNNVEVAQVGPVISDVVASTDDGDWAQPLAGQDVRVTAAVGSPDGIFEVHLMVSNAWVGNFSTINMVDDGSNGDDVSDDGIFSAMISPLNAGAFIRFYIEAVGNSAAQTRSYMPVGAEHDVYYLRVDPVLAQNSSIVVNELMADNTSSQTDEMGEFEDWIELYNKGTEAVDISGWHLSDSDWNIFKWTVPKGTIIQPDSYLIVWADEDGVQGEYHANFRLSALGEIVMLINASGEISDYAEFGPQESDLGFARVPNGVGNLVNQAPTFAANNQAPIGVEEHSSDRLTIYPNPTSGWLSVRLEGVHAQRIEVSDMSGRTMLSHSATSGELHTMDCSSLAAGTYIIRVYHSDGVAVRKLIRDTSAR